MNLYELTEGPHAGYQAVVLRDAAGVEVERVGRVCWYVLRRDVGWWAPRDVGELVSAG